MAPADRPFPPEPQFHAFLKELIEVPKSAFAEAEQKRVKRKRRAKKSA